MPLPSPWSLGQGACRKRSGRVWTSPLPGSGTRRPVRCTVFHADTRHPILIPEVPAFAPDLHPGPGTC